MIDVRMCSLCSKLSHRKVGVAEPRHRNAFKKGVFEVDSKH